MPHTGRGVVHLAESILNLTELIDGLVVVVHSASCSNEEHSSPLIDHVQLDDEDNVDARETGIDG